MRKIILFGCLLLLPATQALAIIQTASTSDANALRDSLIGSGITTVGDATLVAGPNSAGTFTNGSAIGIATGIILSTGNVLNAPGPNTDDGISGDASGSSNALLDTIQGNQDSTSLKFDFTTSSGDLFFDFVFASDEYNEFVNSGFNDVFGFFLDGQNIAIVPGTVNTPVSIDSVNLGSNSSVYVDNEIGSGSPLLDELEYDGLTTVLTAQATNIGAGVHTIELAISDVGDSALDSAVFLAGSTFAATPDPVLPPPVTPVPPPPPGAVPEPTSFLVWSMLLLCAVGARRRRRL